MTATARRKGRAVMRDFFREFSFVARLFAGAAALGALIGALASRST